MIDKMQRITAFGHAKAALEKVKHARHYALGDAELLAIGALLAEWQADHAERGESFTHEEAAKFLEGLRDYAPSLFQNRPPEEKELAKLWVDPVSGQSPPNPFSKATLNLGEQMWLREQEPTLADYLKGTADTGVTYSYLAHQRAEKEAREKIRAIEYEHDKNPYRNGDLAAQSEFRRVNGDAIADFYQSEAKEPVTLPWLPGKDGKPNLSATMAMRRKSPELRELVDRSIETARQWAQEDLLESEREQAAALSRRATAQALLGTKK